MTSFFGIPPITVAGWMAGAVGAVLVVLVAFAAVNRVLLKMALRNIPRRRAQTVLILFGLMLATLITTASLSVGDTSAYSLQAIQMRQIGGIDEAVTKQPSMQYVQGAGTAETDFFTEAQAADVIARTESDADVAAATGVIAASGSLVDGTTGQSASENVAVFGVPADFGSIWGGLRSQTGSALDVSMLAPNEVYVGSLLGSNLDAHPGDTLQLYVDGHATYAVVREVLDTEINPSIANHGPIVSSVLMPLATLRSVTGRAGGYNLILIRNRGGGGIDDLGPQGSTGDAIDRHLSAAFTDQQSAAELWAFLRAPAMKTQIEKLHSSASFLGPDKDLTARLIAELNRPAVTDEFKALVEDRFVQRIIFNAAAASSPSQLGSATPDESAVQVSYLLGALRVNSAAAAELKSFLATPDIHRGLEKLAAPGHGNLAGVLLTEVDRPTVTALFKSMVGDPNLQKEIAADVAQIAPARLAGLAAIVERLDLYTYSAYKADAVLFAQQGGLFAAAALLGVSFFSIAVGILLIFLIFVMLAAERRAEMGMSRAVGLKRRHLTQMFLFEGTAYTLAASVIGMLLGVGVGAAMISVLSQVFRGFYKGIDLTFHIEWTSLVIAVCLGILLTFVVVAFSAYRVSRLNIVAAIRDLDESEQRDAGLLRMFTAPFGVAWLALRQLRRGHPLVFLGRITIGTLGAIRAFWWALFRRGPLTLLLGLALIAENLDNSLPLSRLELLYSAGASLVIIGTGLLIRWILQLAHVRSGIASRAGFTSAALGLIVFWGRPFGRIEDRLHIAGALQLDKNYGGGEVFVLSAMMVLLAAIWLVMFNSDLLIRIVMLVTGRIAGLAPVTRTSMAYPMSTKFRTGMAVAMFAIVTFVVVYMSIFKDVLIQNFGQVDAQSGHWQIVAGSPDFNFNSTDRTAFRTDVATLVQTDSTTAAEVRGVGWENLSGTIIRGVKPDGSVNEISTRGFGLHVVDDGYLSATGYSIWPRAAGYSSDRAVWNAVRDHPGYAVLDTKSLDSADGSPPVVTGISPSAATFRPFQVEIGAGEKGGARGPWRVTVIGFMTRPIWDGIYISTRTAMASGNYFDPGSAGPAGSEGTALSPTGYYFNLGNGVDPHRARLDLGRLLVRDQLQPIVVADMVAQQISSTLTLLNLLTGFLALGLIVGIAGLGVISTRAVVERWQQIGMLRALGFRRALVQRSFLLESSLIAVLGLLIGALIGLWESYRFFVVDQAFGTVDFHVPVLDIGLILVAAYCATLVTTFLPARAASRVAPAEALRYE